MRILVACRAIDNIAGGVERQSAALINAMIARGHEAALLTWDPDTARSFYPLDPKAHWFKMGLGDPMQKAGLALRFKRMQKTRQIMRDFQPDIIIAFQQGTFFSLKIFTLGIRIPMIAAMRNALSILDFVKMGNRRQFILQTLRLANVITVQFDHYREDYPAYLRDKIRAVPNAIEPAAQVANPGEDAEKKTLLAVGRLSFQKNYHLLIEAFQKISDDFPDWQLFIAGEGDERKNLETLINGHDQIEIPGTIMDVSNLYAKAHLYCQPSLWEGFPNALSEALAHGLPSIGFQNCDGVNALIKHNESGLLASNGQTDSDNIDSLAQALKMLMNDEDKRRMMSENALETMRPYQPGPVFDRWEDILKEVLQR